MDGIGTFMISVTCRERDIKPVREKERERERRREEKGDEWNRSGGQHIIIFSYRVGIRVRRDEVVWCGRMWCMEGVWCVDEEKWRKGLLEGVF